MSITNSSKSELRYCPTCTALFGPSDLGIVTCQCARSRALRKERNAHPNPRNDFDQPCQICYFCQANLIRSGSRWSTFYCETCRPTVLQINDLLDAFGMTIIPIGRHSLQHSSWTNVGTFVAIPVLERWQRANLRAYWTQYQGRKVRPDDRWEPFGAFIEKRKGTSRFRNFPGMVRRIQQLPADELSRMLQDVSSTARSEPVDRSPGLPV